MENVELVEIKQEPFEEDEDEISETEEESVSIKNKSVKNEHETLSETKSCDKVNKDNKLIEDEEKSADRNESAVKGPDPMVNSNIKLKQTICKEKDPLPSTSKVNDSTTTGDSDEKQKEIDAVIKPEEVNFELIKVEPDLLEDESVNSNDITDDDNEFSEVNPAIKENEFVSDEDEEMSCDWNEPTESERDPLALDSVLQIDIKTECPSDEESTYITSDSASTSKADDEPGFDDFIEDVTSASFSNGTRIDFTELELEEDESNLLYNINNSEKGENSDSEPEPTSKDSLPNTSLHKLYCQGRPSITLSHNHQTRQHKRHNVLRRHEPNSPGLQWSCVTNYDPGPSHTIPILNANSGPCLPDSFDSETKPIDYFMLFFNDELMNHIRDATNSFAAKRKHLTKAPCARVNKWIELTMTDLKAFLGTIIKMGLVPLANVEDYFSTKWTKRIHFFRDVFSKDHFLNIFYNIYFHSNHAQCQDYTNTGSLIMPVVDHIKRMCKLFFTTGNCVIVDESTVSCKGNVTFCIYNKNKPTKFEMKVSVLSDCDTGYIYDFVPYCKKQDLIPNSTLLKTTQIVKLMTESVVYKDQYNPTSGLHVYTDRYYTSPELAIELLKINSFLTGTVMTHRIGMPSGLKSKYKKMKRGDVFSQRQDDVLIVSWKDKKVVTVLSTNNMGSRNEMTLVPSKWPGQPSTYKPNVVLDYTKHMGVVNRRDHFISLYQFLRRTRKCYRKMFFWLLEVSIVNSFLLYKATQQNYHKKPMSHADFRDSLIVDLVAEKMVQPRARNRGRQPQGPPEQRLDGKQHFIGRKQKTVRCIVCAKKGIRRETIYFCKTCVSNPSLHPDDCFETYHTVHNYY